MPNVEFCRRSGLKREYVNQAFRRLQRDGLVELAEHGPIHARLLFKPQEVLNKNGEQNREQEPPRL